MSKRIGIAATWMAGLVLPALAAMPTPPAPAAAAPTAPAAGNVLTVQTPGAKPATPAKSSEDTSYKTYTFIGDKYRDPFVPLTGEFRSDQNALDRPPQI